MLELTRLICKIYTVHPSVTEYPSYRTNLPVLRLWDETNLPFNIFKRQISQALYLDLVSSLFIPTIINSLLLRCVLPLFTKVYLFKRD
ncbi:unnamed protein product [Periconia digitata]|uniref:Uncharacterized protein n=1 Tax=Periconia digitata TaxID=1303443 RepID=A0A9W4U288_9PLEO|nr:unnamed protein product [Periconia digitata]